MTPAIDQLNKLDIVHQVHSYAHDPRVKSYGDEAVELLGLNPTQVFKTLVVEDERGDLVVAVVPVSSQLSLKRLAKALVVKKVTMAAVDKVERSSGYRVGGVSPIGQKQALRTVIDSSAQDLSVMHVSAGKRGLEISLSSHDLAKACQASFHLISAD